MKLQVNALLFILAAVYLFTVQPNRLSESTPASQAVNTAMPSLQIEPGTIPSDEITYTSFAKLQEVVEASMKRRDADLTLLYQGDTSRLKQELDGMFTAIFDKDNYLHYATESYTADYRYKGSKATLQFRFTYWEGAAETKYVEERTLELVKELIHEEMTPLDKEKAIHDWIALHVKFDSTLVNHSAYAGLSEEQDYRTVCQGYALLAYRMLTLAGIESRIVEGIADEQAHIWNMVKLGDKWRHVDFTWDRSLPGHNVPSYAYFNLTDEEMGKDHFWTKSYPKAE